ncbi:CDP-glycerol glycerophosphotransferase family protein [Phocicoccus pinnipedialis]|uniref:CDP-glycerol:glycerophosphate glycerophosphotransferase n=1 Tax=Phocicoccus pinnipedialis TaxID=110845 RepID=A0A6V7R752_9BACL|nr:CDP-glycerol glycerophosphotransferase family protein [Jeotgalicoccus pinnipedialis]MBP1938960.1 CDP-glycerol glycerophosphotransferase (TagB/SpsB family) [Jeotgalicoccus pinnipedialis]CAD2073201.1 Putative CDP-glycerol:glycerophosphate glycerophosphotransferase [Jeotgalicoccus pinnipedialis]
MIKELALQLYVLFVKWFFLINRKKHPQNKIVFVSSFIENASVTIPKLMVETKKEVVFYNFSKRPFDYHHTKLTTHNKHDYKTHIKMLRDIATASEIIIDNFYPFLGAARLIRGTIIQTWHAVGAFKKFALEDHSLDKRSILSYRRFKKSYRNIDYVLNGSTIMGNIFKKSFGLKNDCLLNFGMPSSDFYSNQAKVLDAKSYMTTTYPTLKGQTVITYAPTYRDKIFEVHHLELDIKYMLDTLPESYSIILRLHPAVNFNDQRIKNKRVLNLSNVESIENVLSITDILITDYSSVAFDFANFNKPIIFYPYDLKDYEHSRGLTGEYTNLVTGKIAYNTIEIVDFIIKNNFDISDIGSFKNKWNEFSKGNNTQLLIEKIY